MRTSGGWGIWVKRGGPSVVGSPSDRQKPCVQEKAVEQIAFPANGNGVPPMNGDVTSKLFEQIVCISTQHYKYKKLAAMCLRGCGLMSLSKLHMTCEQKYIVHR